MLYRFGSTRNPSDQYLRVYSEHAATLADCGALHRIRRWRFVAIVDEKEKPFSDSMIGLRRIRLVRRLWFAFSTCALFGFHSARRDARRCVALAAAGSSPGAAPAAQRAGDAGCRSAFRRIKSYLCEKMRVAGEVDARHANVPSCCSV
ncbi:hypothetical protein LL998_08115 [Burkholderia ambifaria]|uniref:hypothetical protein n=1 Tax=Burkholderia ambifaria TaxID=152480 RepID=UPI001E3E17E0|nr:hypothetical protein [Burkholderia ambifaria]UEP36235.1 hypothetical protein LL998_08115 [Burkholderia ambifaria]